MCRRGLHEAALMIGDDWTDARHPHAALWVVPVLGDEVLGLLLMGMVSGWMNQAHPVPQSMTSTLVLVLVFALMIAVAVGLWITLAALILAGGGLVLHPENPTGGQNDDHEYPQRRGDALRFVRRTWDWWIAGWTFWLMGSLPVLPTEPTIRIGQPEQIGDAVDPANQHESSSHDLVSQGDGDEQRAPEEIGERARYVHNSVPSTRDAMMLSAAVPRNHPDKAAKPPFSANRLTDRDVVHGSPGQMDNQRMGQFVNDRVPPESNDNESNKGEHQFYDTASLPVSNLHVWSVFRVLIVILTVIAALHWVHFSTR